MTKESDMKPHGLSEEQLTHYREEGFVDVPGLFDREDLRAAEDAIEELTTRAVNDPANLAEVLELEPELVDGRRIPRRLYNPFLAHEGFRSIATWRFSGEAMRGCADARVKLAKRNCKPNCLPKG